MTETYTPPRRLHWGTGETRSAHSRRSDMIQRRSICGLWMWDGDQFAVWKAHATCGHCRRMIDVKG